MALMLRGTLCVAHVFILKEKFKFPTPLTNSPPSTRKKGQIPAFLKGMSNKKMYCFI
jgi:hypothetical protein